MHAWKYKPHKHFMSSMFSTVFAAILSSRSKILQKTPKGPITFAHVTLNIDHMNHVQVSMDSMNTCSIGRILRSRNKFDPRWALREASRRSPSFAMSGERSQAYAARHHLASGTADDPFAESRGLEILVSAGFTIHTVGCSLVTRQALNTCAEYCLCRRCVILTPKPENLMFLNALDTVPLAHNSPSCLLTGNTDLRMATVCKHCFGKMPPAQTARVEMKQRTSLGQQNGANASS